MQLALLKDITVNQTKELVNGMLGIPYKHLGRDKMGLDCWGVIIYAYKKFGYQIQDWKEYEEDWSKKDKNYFMLNFYKDYYKRWQPVEIPALLDVVLFEGKNGIMNHAGIVVDINKFLHCPKMGVMLSTFHHLWLNKNPKFYRLKERIDGTKKT